MKKVLAAVLWLLFAQAAGAQPEACYILVRSQDGAVLAEYRADALMVPASTLKVVSAAAILESLAPATRLETRVRQVGERRGDVLEGHLVLEGGFDPALRSSDLTALAAQLFAGGLRRVRGDVLVADPWKGQPYPPGWAWEDMAYPFSAPISGLVVDEATQEVAVLGPGEVEPAVQVREDPTGLEAVRYPGRKGLWLSGSVAPGQSPTLRVAVTRPALQAGRVFRERLRQGGVRVEGGVREVEAPIGEVVAIHRSPTLAQLLEGGLARSHNLTLEMLYRLGGGQPPQGVALRMVDGSGLSRYNLISPRGLARVLRAQPRLAELLPGPGRGTLAGRFVDSPAAPFLRAKTGTMGGVSGLAGYLFPGQEDECVFAILINGYLGPVEEAKRLEEELVEGWVTALAWPYLQ